MTLAQNERRSLCDTLLEVGPDAPTLCEGWDARDLATHLVVRDRHPAAMIALGLSASGLPGAGRAAQHTDAVRQRVSSQEWSRLVDQVRSGPPAWHPARLGVVDDQMNLTEFFVHHEDLRRAQPDWSARLTPYLDAPLWRACRIVARLALRKVPVGVELVTSRQGSVVVRRGEPVVRVEGDPAELTLFAFGRRSVAQVRLDGPPAAVAALKGSTSGW